MDETALAQRAGQSGLDGVDQPGGAVGDDQQRAAQPAGDEPVEEAGPGVGGLRPARASSPTNTGLPSVVMPHAASTGSARAPACILKMTASKNR